MEPFGIKAIIVKDAEGVRRVSHHLQRRVDLLRLVNSFVEACALRNVAVALYQHICALAYLRIPLHTNRALEE